MPFCPDKPYWIVADDDTTKRFPASCNRYRCPVCGHKKVYERVKLMAWGAYSSRWCTFMTWTKVPERFQQARAQMRDWVRRMRKNYELEIAWSIEPNPKGTGYHAHGLQTGDYLNHRDCQRMWGERHVWIEKLTGDAAGYCSKAFNVAGYSTKDGMAHLDLNGGRAVHMSRGYLLGWRARDVLKNFFKGDKFHVEIATPYQIAVQNGTIGKELCEGELPVSDVNGNAHL